MSVLDEILSEHIILPSQFYDGRGYRIETTEPIRRLMLAMLRDALACIATRPRYQGLRHAQGCPGSACVDRRYQRSGNIFLQFRLRLAGDQSRCAAQISPRMATLGTPIGSTLTRKARDRHPLISTDGPLGN